MTRRTRTSSEAENRLDALDEQRREPDSNEWRALLNLPPSASRVDGWRALLRGDGGEDTWHAYTAAESGRP